MTVTSNTSLLCTTPHLGMYCCHACSQLQTQPSHSGAVNIPANNQSHVSVKSTPPEQLDTALFLSGQVWLLDPNQANMSKRSSACMLQHSTALVDVVMHQHAHVRCGSAASTPCRVGHTRLMPHCSQQHSAQVTQLLVVWVRRWGAAVGCGGGVHQQA
jgi:hypothetical protein